MNFAPLVIPEMKRRRTSRGGRKKGTMTGSPSRRGSQDDDPEEEDTLAALPVTGNVHPVYRREVYTHSCK